MTPIPLPTKGQDIRDLWQVVAKCARAVNAIAKMGGKGVKFTLTDDNATLEVQGSGAATSSSAGGGIYLEIVDNGTIAYMLIPGASVTDSPTAGTAIIS